MLGYVTILADGISLNRGLKDEFRSKGIDYKSLPALKIGRLCVDERYEGKGIGTVILAFCIKRICYLNNHTAFRFITIDAKRNADRKKDSLYFYKKFNFSILEHKDKSVDELIKQKSGETPMYMDMYHIIKKTVTTLK